MRFQPPTPSQVKIAAAALAAVAAIVAGPHWIPRAVGLAGLGTVGGVLHRRRAAGLVDRALGAAAAQTLQDLENAESLGVAKGRKAGSDEARAAAAALYERTIANIKNELETHLQQALGDLGAVRAERDKLAKTVAVWQARGRQVKAAAEKIASERQELTMQRQRLELAIDQSEVSTQSRINAAQIELNRAGERIEQLQDLADSYAQQIDKMQRQESAQIEAALSAALQPKELQIAQLQARLNELITAKASAETRARIESTLLDFDQLLSKYGAKPALFCGGEGSGKGTSIVAYLRALANSFGGVIPLVLDPSEDRIWELCGIPSTANKALFFDTIKVTMSKAKTHRIDRTRENQFSQQPPIVFIFDELASLYSGLKNEQINEYQDILDSLRTRGNKYGCIPLFTSISEQIQNLKSNGKQVLNSGTIGAFYRVWLNESLEEYASRYPQQISQSLRDWLTVSAGEYQAAIVQSEGGAKQVCPMRHPSHHGQCKGEKSPTVPVIGPKLAPPPDFWPLAARLLSASPVPLPTESPQPLPQESPQPGTISPMASAILNFAIASNEAVTANKFRRLGGKFYQGASRLKSHEIERSFDELIERGIASASMSAQGYRLLTITLTQQAA